MDLLIEKIQMKLERAVQDFNGMMGVYAQDTSNPENKVFVNEKIIFPTASSIKVAILIEFFRKAEQGIVDLLEPLTLNDEHIAAGSGVLQELHPGEVTMPLIDYATLMITVSDNIGTNIMIDTAGMADVNKMLRGLGLVETKLQRKMIDWRAAAEGRENISTPEEMATLMDCLYHRRGLSEYVCSNTIEILKKPKMGSIRESVPDDIPVANKTGTLSGVMCDNGIVYLPEKPYVISVMTKHTPLSDFRNRETAAAVRAVTKTVHDYFEEMSLATGYGRRF